MYFLLFLVSIIFYQCSSVNNSHFSNELYQSFIDEYAIQHGGLSLTALANTLGYTVAPMSKQTFSTCLNESEAFLSHGLVLPMCIKEGCFSASQLQTLFNVSNHPLTPDVLIEVAPILLRGIVLGKCNESEQQTHVDVPSTLHIWLCSLASVTVVSISSLVGALMLPCTHSRHYPTFLSFMISLAVGALSGTALFFLIPDTYGLSESRDNQYIFKSCVVLLGLYFFFLSERLFRIFIDYKKTRFESVNNEQDAVMCSIEHFGQTAQLSIGQSSCLGEVTEGERDTFLSPASVSIKSKEKESFSCVAITPLAWMIILGDGLHNFIDGIAIGAAFDESILSGVSVSVAILCEELPHELGDLAVLLKSGIPIRRALCFNFLSACMCYFGMVLGIFVGHTVAGSKWIFAVAGGVFLYISLADLLPELNEGALGEVQCVNKCCANNLSPLKTNFPKASFKLLAMQSAGMFLGWFVVGSMAYFGKYIQFS